MGLKASPLETFFVFLKLGTTCFGGPVAHFGYFHEEFVVRRKWLDDHAFADIVALCQFLPGPASSQVGLAIGMHRAGWLGAFAAWIGFTMPSVVLMITFAYGVDVLGNVEHAGWLAGLKLAALAVVAQAVWAMASKFCIERMTASLAIGGAIIVLTWSSGISQIFVIAMGAILGWMLFRHEAVEKKADGESGHLHIPYGPRLGFILLAVFLLLLVGLPVLKAWTQNSAVASFDSFYRTGSLVFGGGHVVLPLLQTAVVNPGWVSNDKFLAGYGAAQALPGPLFSFAAYLGAVMKPQPNGWLGGMWCLLAIYVPAALLVFSSLPFWESLRRQSFARAMLKGANASVVGILLAALYQPVWTSAVHGPRDFILALATYGLLVFWALPPWLVVALSALGGALLLR
jgi:chromate transporter